MEQTVKQRVALFYLICALLLVAPIIAMLFFPSPVPLSLAEKIAIALGFIGLTLAGLLFIPVARIPGLGNALELDKMYKLHHKLSLVAILLIALHPTVLIIFHNPMMVALLNPLNKMPVWAAGAWGMIFFILIGITSAFRKDFRIPYNVWLIIHDVLAVALFVSALVHIFNVQLYTARKAMAGLWVLQAVLWLGLTLWVRLIRPLKLARMPYIVKEVVAQPNATYDLFLVRKDGKPAMPFKAGQIAWIGTGSPFQISRNPFSFAGSSEDKEKLRFSIQVAGDFTSTIASLKPGDTVYVDGPYGACNINGSAMKDGIVLMGGGIGMAPVMSILNSLADMHDKRPVFCFYGDFNEDKLLYTEEFEDIRKRLPQLELVKVLEKPISPEYTPRGYINRALVESTLPGDYKKFYYFMCGPLPMMTAMKKMLAAMGVPENHIGAEEYDMA